MKRLLGYGLSAITLFHAAVLWAVFLATQPQPPRLAPQPAEPEDAASVLATLRLRAPPPDVQAPPPSAPPVITWGPAPEVIQTAPVIPMPEEPELRSDLVVAVRQERRELAIEALNERASIKQAALAARRAAMLAAAEASRAKLAQQVARSSRVARNP